MHCRQLLRQINFFFIKQITKLVCDILFLSSRASHTHHTYALRSFCGVTDGRARTWTSAALTEAAACTSASTLTAPSDASARTASSWSTDSSADVSYCLLWCCKGYYPCFSIPSVQAAAFPHFLKEYEGS